MRGNVFTPQVFTLLRELTATDYQKGVNCNCFTSMDHAKWDCEQHFFMNRASKEGACLYNKWLTSTLNPIPPET